MALQIKTNIANVKQPPDILKYHEFRKPTFHQHNVHHCNEDRGKVLELFLKKLFSRTISRDPRNLTAKTRYSRGEGGKGGVPSTASPKATQKIFRGNTVNLRGLTI